MPDAHHAALAIEHGFVPPALGDGPIDPKVDLNIPTEKLTGRFRRVLSNSFAFGGHNACLVLG